jgi:ABC-2 type transport system ATP-binding protein
MTILLSSHLLHQVQEVCDRVGIFVGGRLIAAGPVATLERQLSQSADLEIEVRAVTAAGNDLPGKTRPLGQVAVSAGDGELVQDLPRVHSAVLEQDMWVVRGRQDVRADVARVLAARSLLPIHLRLRSLSLDDIYDRYFREEAQATDGSN